MYEVLKWMIKYYNNKGTFKRSQISKFHYSVLIHVHKFFQFLKVKAKFDKDIKYCADALLTSDFYLNVVNILHDAWSSD